MIEPGEVLSLVEKAKAGDRQAFDELFEGQKPRLRTAVEAQVRRGGARIDPEEVLQETLVQAFRSIGRFGWQGEDSFFLWLCGISRNVLLKLGERSRRNRLLRLPERLEDTGTSPSSSMRRGERFERLEKAFSRLPPDYREVLRLSRLEGLKVAEIARRMDRSENAVKHLMARAMRQLRATFGSTNSLHLPDRALEPEGGKGDSS